MLNVTHVCAKILEEGGEKRRISFLWKSLFSFLCFIDRRQTENPDLALERAESDGLRVTCVKALVLQIFMLPDVNRSSPKELSARVRFAASEHLGPIVWC